MFIASLVFIGLSATSIPPDFLLSSVLIIVMYAGVSVYYGLISIPTIAMGAAYLPALAFLWSWANGGEYINYHNHWLQEQSYYVNISLSLVCGAMFSTIAVLLIFSRSTVSRARVLYGASSKLSDGIYLIVILLAGFMFWLTEPSFKTIISSAYLDVKGGGEGTQFAGALALIFWIISFLTYSITHSSSQYNKRWLDYLFEMVTLLAFLWLILHARRSELIGMGLIVLLAFKEVYGSKRAMLLAIVMLFILLAIGAVRSVGLIMSVQGDVSLSSFVVGGNVDGSIVSLPGGMSNIYMTFVNALHYFEVNGLLYGETYLNYLLQMLPTNIYVMLGLDRPPYFFNIYYGNYSYNGGTYLGAPFYGNFGLIGMVVYGVMTAVYILVISRFLGQKNFVLRLMALFMLAILFRAYWYEAITVLKPIVIVFLPLYIAHHMMVNQRLRPESCG